MSYAYSHGLYRFEYLINNNILTFTVSSATGARGLCNAWLSSNSRTRDALQLPSFRLVRAHGASLAGVTCRVQICTDGAGHCNYFCKLKIVSKKYI